MSAIYSKLAAVSAAAGFLCLLAYYKLQRDTSSISGGHNAESAKAIGQAMIAKMRETEDTIAELQYEIGRLRQQLEESNHVLNQISNRQLVPFDSHTEYDGQRRSTLRARSISREADDVLVNEFGRASRDTTNDNSIDASRHSRVSACNPRVSQIRSESGISNNTQQVRFYPSIISSKHAAEPPSDDEIWRSPQISYSTDSDGSDDDEHNVSARRLDARLEHMATHCVASLDSLGSLDCLGPEYTYIAMDMTTYTPLASKSLPQNVTNLITEIDHIYNNDAVPGIEKDIQEAWDLLMEAVNDCKVYAELTWRVCRTAIYLRTVWDSQKVAKKMKYFCEKGLEFGQIGLDLLETHPYNISQEQDETLYNELRVTAVAPMMKWAGSCIGCAAEIAPGVSEKIRYGFKSRDLYKAAMKLDANDYYTYYSLGRWHWEVYKLPWALRRSVNWISPEPFNSTPADVMPVLEEALSRFPQKYPFLYRPPDILLLMAQCLLDGKDKAGAKQYAVEAKENMVKLYGNTMSPIDRMTLNDIETILKHV